MNVGFDFSELAMFININSYSRNKSGVDENGRLLRSIMETMGYKTIVYERKVIGNHLHFISSKRTGKKLLLLGHLDTVYPPNTFESFQEDDEWIYGPGVCDMKGGFYLALTALRHVKEINGEIANIDMLVVSDEETGSDDSKYTTSEIAKGYDACLVFEAAGSEDEVVIERKGVATLQIQLEGKAAHSGNHYSKGIDANLAAARMLIALTELTNLAAGTTVNVGKIEGGIGANTISPKAELIVEARFTNSNERDRVLEAINAISNNPHDKMIRVTVSGGLQRDVMQNTSQQAEFLSELEEILGEEIKTEKRGGVSDANTIFSAGVPTLDGFGPYGDGDHTIKERACKESFSRRLKLVSKILLAYSAEKD